MLPWTDPLNPVPGEIMRDIIGDLKHHLRTHVHPGLHLLLGVLLTAAFVYNYSTGFKRAVMNAHPGSWVEIPMYLAFYGVPFYGALLLQSRLTRVSLPRDGRFWLVSALALLLLVLNRSALSLSPRLLDDLDLSRTVIWYLNKVLINLVRAVAPPYPGAFEEIAGDKITVTRTRLVPPAAHPALQRAHGTQDKFFEGGKLYARCGDGNFLQILGILINDQDASLNNYLKYMAS